MDNKPCKTVYFRGFPDDFTQDSATEIFSEFGNIVKCFIVTTPGNKYGMVEFDNVSSCSEAILQLNGQPPLNLYCNMAKNQATERHTPKPKVSFDREPEMAVTYEEEEFFVDENNELVNILKDPLTNEIYVPIRYATNIRRLVKKVPVTLGQAANNGFLNNGNISDNDDAASDLSLTNSRRINFNPRSHDLNITVQSDSDSPKGAKHQNHFQTGEHSRRNFNKPVGSHSQSTGDDGEHSRRNFNKNVGSHSQSTGEDGEHSRRNFNKNAGSHFQSGDDGKRAKFQGGDNRGENKSRFPKKDFNNKPSGFDRGDNKFRPHNKFSMSEKGDGNFSDSHKNKFQNKFTKSSNNDEGDWGAEAEQQPQSTPTDKPSFSKNFKSKPSQERDSFPAEKSVIVEDKPQSSSAFQSSTPQSSTPRSALAKRAVKKPTYKSVELPQNQFTQVKVEHVESENKGWVQICSMAEDFMKVFEKVITHLENTDTKPVKPEVGLLCLANFEDIWFRAIVLKSYPKVYVRFIDYGNESIVEGDILELPADLQTIPAFAVCINLIDGAPCKLKNELTLSVKPIKMENDVIDVQVENGIYEQETPVNPLLKCQESMMKKLKPAMVGIIQGTIKVSETEAVAFFMPNDMGTDILALDELAPLVADAPCIKPKVGEFIAAQNEGWNRGVVLDTSNGYKIAFIDFGVIKTVKEIKTLPDKFHQIPQFSCLFSAKNVNKLVNCGDDAPLFEITKIENGIVYCSVTCDEENIDISFVLWNPMNEAVQPVSTKSEAACVKPVEEKVATQKIPKLKLKNGDECKIIHVDPEFLYLRTREGAELVKKVDGYISKCAEQAPKLSEEPTVGQCVAAQFNGAWYRAVITAVKPNAATVLFVDYGNEEVKPFFSLKQLNEQCLQEPCSAIQIKLRGFTDKKFSQKCICYLEKLYSNQILRLSIKSDMDSGVDLNTKDGKNVNDELAKLDHERPKNAEKQGVQLRKETYMGVSVPGNEDERITSSFDIEKIQLGETDIKFLSVIDLATYTISICPSDHEMLHKIQVELISQTTKYGNLVAPRLPYSPVEDEIVLVAHGGKWYRGLTLDVASDTNIQIYLVDYGFVITATSDELRKMPKEFVDEYKFLASFATIQGLPPTPSKKLIDRLNNYFVKNEVYKVEVLDEVDQAYSILIPDLLQVLKSENLI